MADQPAKSVRTWNEAQIRKAFEGPFQIPVYPGPNTTKPGHTADSLMYQLNRQSAPTWGETEIREAYRLARRGTSESDAAVIEELIGLLLPKY